MKMKLPLLTKYHYEYAPPMNVNQYQQRTVCKHNIVSNQHTHWRYRFIICPAKQRI